MSTKEKMQTARAHIQRKEYDDARRILSTVDHPKAREWEAKIDRVAPRRSWLRRHWLKVVVVVFAVILVALGILVYQAGQEAGQVWQRIERVDALETYCILDYERYSGNPRPQDCYAWAGAVVDVAEPCFGDDDYVYFPEEFTGCLVPRLDG